MDLSGDVLLVAARRPEPQPHAVYVFHADNGGLDGWGLQTTLAWGDGTGDTTLGLGLGVSGDTAVVGVPGDDGLGNDLGAVHIFDRDQGGAGHWGWVRKLTGSDSAADDGFGRYVALSGDVLAVSAPGHDDPRVNAGAVYVFYRDAGGAGNWGQVAKLSAPDAAINDALSTIATTGNVIVAGAPWADNAGEPDSGAAYVFGRDQGGADSWGFVAKLMPPVPAARDWFGGTASASEDVVVVGAWARDDMGYDAGAAYVFHRDAGGPNHWGLVKTLVAPGDAEAAAFGQWVSVSGEVLVVGAALQGTRRDLSGAAYVYHRNKGGEDNWGLATELVAADAKGYHRFGTDIAVSGDVLAVGASEDSTGLDAAGSVYIYRATH